MISHLRGTVVHISEGAAIVDVGGIGYLVHGTEQTLSRAHPGKPLQLWTYLAVRESALDLYGFTDREELVFFEKLLSVSGIGPKTALAIVGLAPVKTLAGAINSKDPAYLTRVSGIGRKTAQKIVLELQDKIGMISSDSAATTQDDTDTILALETLGYSLTAAREVVQKLSPHLAGTRERLKEALKILGAPKQHV